jgi:DNA-directed RNA polymerase subunit RPC12/RpoP
MVLPAGRRLQIADTPKPKLVFRCRRCHHEIAVDSEPSPKATDGARCPDCGYRNVFGLEPAKAPGYSPR